MDNEKRPRGRPFPKGNPGRKPGSKNKATLLTASLAGGTGEEILRKAIEMAKGGNVAMMKFLLDRILPKERPIQLELPHLHYAHDSVDAMAEIIDAVSSGGFRHGRRPMLHNLSQPLHGQSMLPMPSSKLMS